MRSRESRITCQSGPLIGRDTPPARQPRAYEPIARAARGAGPGTEPNSTFAGPAGVLLTSFGATGGCTAAAFAGSLTGSAATGPQIRNSNKQAVILLAISITKQAIRLEARFKTGALAPATPMCLDLGCVAPAHARPAPPEREDRANFSSCGRVFAVSVSKLRSCPSSAQSGRANRANDCPL